MHKGPTLYDILPKLNNAQYLSLIDVSSGYHNLKLDEKSSYLTFACQFGRTQIQKITVGSIPCRRYVPTKIDEIFKELPNVFCIVDEILVV